MPPGCNSHMFARAQSVAGAVSCYCLRSQALAKNCFSVFALRSLEVARTSWSAGGPTFCQSDLNLNLRKLQHLKTSLSQQVQARPSISDHSLSLSLWMLSPSFLLLFFFPAVTRFLSLPAFSETQKNIYYNTGRSDCLFYSLSRLEQVNIWILMFGGWQQCPTQVQIWSGSKMFVIFNFAPT